MAIEIERKYMVTTDGWKQNKCKEPIEITQWYIGVDPKRTVRVRIEPDRCVLCIKGKNVGASRIEVESDISFDEAQQLLALMAEGTQVVEKIRHYSQGPDGMIWEIDEFFGANQGLIVAELELDGEDSKFVLPDWVGQEVTTAYIYSNSHLAQVPFGTWVIK